VIYCVVPRTQVAELYDRLVAHYEEDPDVTVIVDRRERERREPGSRHGGNRELRDRRRRRPGSIPALVSGD
jgi:hypothetical protein